MVLLEPFPEPEEAHCTRQLLMQNSHQGVEHLRRHIEVNICKSFIIHLVLRAENVLSELLYFFLIAYSIPIVNIFAFFVFVHAFLHFDSLSRVR